MGWINKTVDAVWRAGTAAGQVLRPRAQNQIVDGLTLEQALRGANAGISSHAGVTVNVRNASGLAAVAASVRVLSNSLSHLPLVLFRGDSDRRVPARDLPLFKLLHDKPNRWQTSFQWRKLLSRDLYYRGNAYCYIVGGGSRVLELIRLHPDCVKPVQDKRTLDVTYEYRRPDGGRDTFQRDEILHIWTESDDGIVGLNPLQIYRQSIGDGLALREHGSRFFSNAARLGGVLETPEGAQVKDEVRNAILKDFDASYTGGTNAHRTAMLPAGISFKPVSISMEDAQWIEARKITAREIYGIFGIPPHKAGDLADATFSNVEHMNIEYLIDALAPQATAWEQSINSDILGNPDDMFVKFNLNALLRGDAKSRAQALNILRRAGVINANEWRRLEDMNPRTDAGGDEYIVEQNMRAQDGNDLEETQR